MRAKMTAVQRLTKRVVVQRRVSVKNAQVRTLKTDEA
jgi:hypothetical protein